MPPACPLSESLALLRGAWAPNVIWYLSGEPRRFGELRHDIPRISARVLSARLRELESRGLVTRRVLDSSHPRRSTRLPNWAASCCRPSGRWPAWDRS